MTITHLQAVELAVPDLVAARHAFTRFLGIEPAAQDDDSVLFAWPRAPRLRLTRRPTHRLAFGVTDLARAARRLKRLSIDGGQPSPATAESAQSTPPSLDLPLEATRGMSLGLIEAAHSASSAAITGDGRSVDAGAPRNADAAHIAGIDLVLISAPDRLEALALYGAVLGLDLRLDQPVPGGHRLQQYACADVVIEVTQRADQTPPHDELIGIGWKVDDIQAAHARLQAAGLALSPVRPGIKPGTQTFTLREEMAGLRFIVIQPA